MRFIIALIGWCILLVICWPLALILAVLMPVLWLIALPFRIAGFAVEATLRLIKTLFMLPAYIMGYRSGRK